MKNIVYVSTSVTLMNSQQLMDLLTVSRKNNAQHNITGVLLYAEGTFLQVLEGNDADVDYTIAKLYNDKRHKNIITLIDEPISDRTFTDWQMGFATVTASNANDLIGYLRNGEKLSTKNGDSPAATTVKTFIDSNKLPVNY